MIVRHYEKGEEEEVNDLFNRCYSKNRTMLQWEWEFKKGFPFAGILVVVEDEKHIVGTQALLPAYLSINGQKILTAKSEATLLDPIYRGKKLFEKMYNFIFESVKSSEIKLIWGFTGAIKPFQNVGFSIEEPLCEYWLVNSIVKSFFKIYRENMAGKKIYSLKP